MPCEASMPLARCQGTVQRSQPSSGFKKAARLSFRAAFSALPAEDRLASHKAAATSGQCSSAYISRQRALEVKAQLFRPPIFDPRKLSTTFLPGTSERGPLPPAPRCYTLTHNDLTGQLSLSIGSSYNTRQVSGWYTRLIRDEVLAEWRFEGDGCASLHVHCHVSGEERWLAPPALRNYIFQREMPLVLETLLHADRVLLNQLPSLAGATVFVHLSSHVQELNATLQWGMLTQRSTWRSTWQSSPSTIFAAPWGRKTLTGGIGTGSLGAPGTAPEAVRLPADPVVAAWAVAEATVAGRALARSVDANLGNAEDPVVAAGMVAEVGPAGRAVGDELLVAPLVDTQEAAPAAAADVGAMLAAADAAVSQRLVEAKREQPMSGVSNAMHPVLNGQGLPGPGSLNRQLQQPAGSLSDTGNGSGEAGPLILPGQQNMGSRKGRLTGTQLPLQLDGQSSRAGEFAAESSRLGEASAGASRETGAMRRGVPDQGTSDASPPVESIWDGREGTGEPQKGRGLAQAEMPGGKRVDLTAEGASGRAKLGATASAGDGAPERSGGCSQNQSAAERARDAAVDGYPRAASYDAGGLLLGISGAHGCPGPQLGSPPGPQLGSRPGAHLGSPEPMTVRSIVSEWLASGHEVITVRR